MQTGNRDYYGKNQYWTPPNIGITQSLIGSALSNVTLNNNGDDLFDVIDIDDGQAIAPNENLPIQASNFKITSSDEDIVADNSNACSVGVVREFIDNIDTKLLENYMTEAECDSKYLTKNGWQQDHYSDPPTTGYSKTEVDNTFATITTTNTISNNLTNNYYDKTTTDSTFATQSTVNTINNNLTNNYYTKTQVDAKIAAIDLSDYATKEWVEAAISSGGDVGPVVATETGEYTDYAMNCYVDFNKDPTTGTDSTMYSTYGPRNHYKDGYASSWYVQSPLFSIKGSNDGTTYGIQILEEWIRNELEFRMRVVKTMPVEHEEEEAEDEAITEDLGLMVLFAEDVDKYILKGICKTANDPESFHIDFQVVRKATSTNIPDMLELHYYTDRSDDAYARPWIRIIKEINNNGFVTTKKLDETKTEIANTYLSQASAQTTYATKSYVDSAISDIPDGGMKTISYPINSQTLTVAIEDTATTGHINLIEVAESETVNIINVSINCTISSNGTDISHNLDDYTFQVKDSSDNPLCTLNSIYETNNTTTLNGSYTGQITSSNKQLVLYITRTVTTPAESIVLTTTETSIGTVSQTISGYISKVYADDHYASKDTPTTVNITNYDNSTHTTNKTTYDFGPDFTIKFDSLIGISIKMKSRNPVVQMATAALTNVLQFGLNKITSSITSNANEVTASANTYESDIYNVIGTDQLSALTDFATWVSNYNRYSGTTLNNFLITAAAAEQRYLKVGSLTNYYTKTQTDNAISTAIANIPTPTIGKLEWTADIYNMKLEPETLSSQGEGGTVTVTMLNFKEGSHTLARIVTSPSSMSPISNIHAHKFSPVNGIEFGYNIDGTNQLTQWSGTISNIANDNYDSTTYSSANLDTIVPSLKYLRTQLTNIYTKTETDNKYVGKTNPGTLTGNLTVNGEIYTSSITTTGDINLTQGAVLDASGDTQIGGDLTVDGTTTLNDNVTIEGQTEINNDCNVNGCFTLDGDLNITNSGALDVIGSSTFHYDVTCNDILTVDSTLYTNDFVATGIVELRTSDIVIGTSGNTIIINKAFFDSILARLHALDGQ